MSKIRLPDTRRIRGIYHLTAQWPCYSPKLDPPKVDVGVSLEEWNVFTRRLDAFIIGSGLDPTNRSSQLFQCAGDQLGDAILKMDKTIASGPTATLLATMKSLAVISLAPGVLRSELMQLQQDRGMTFCIFAAEVHGKAETCGYTRAYLLCPPGLAH